jgi:hypothetical protein
MELQVTPTVIAYNSILSAAAKTGDLSACELFGSAATGKLRLIPRIWRNGQIIRFGQEPSGCSQGPFSDAMMVWAKQFHQMHPKLPSGKLT